VAVTVTHARSGYAGPVDVAGFVAEDERGLETAAPVARVGVVRAPALSFGVGHRPTPTTQGRAHQRGWAWVARRSGGTSLYHAPGDLVWSIVLPRADPRVGRDYVGAYDRLGSGLVRWLSARGITGAWAPASNALPSYCLLNGRGRTLQVGGRALAGAAQHVTRLAMLHHGVVCASVDEEAIASVFDVPRERVAAGLTGVRALGLDDAPEALASELADHLRRFVASAPD
jgi:lipoate-protein ligase A